ncbi:hypothetical protein LZ30DRAFT_690496 [Colletotrichum cereale]|nr:hypothetical protein LZ30DRAFT_690496 [Colletotrichum cereale]
MSHAISVKTHVSNGTSRFMCTSSTNLFRANGDISQRLDCAGVYPGGCHTARLQYTSVLSGAYHGDIRWAPDGSLLVRRTAPENSERTPIPPRRLSTGLFNSRVWEKLEARPSEGSLTNSLSSFVMFINNTSASASFVGNLGGWIGGSRHKMSREKLETSVKTLLQAAVLAVAATAASIPARDDDNLQGFGLRAKMIYPDFPDPDPLASSAASFLCSHVSNDKCQAGVVIVANHRFMFYITHDAIGLIFDK